MAILCLSWAIIKVDSSSSVLVYPGDVVKVVSISGYWYDHVILTSAVPHEDSRLAYRTYYTETSPTEQTQTSESSPSKNFSFPQIIPVENSHHNYLLTGSEIDFNFVVENPSQFSRLAKVCQFSRLKDFEDIRDSKTNGTIIAVERRGVCKLIEEGPNVFVIENTGYYWYVLSTLLSPDPDTVNVRTSYMYNLTKVSYNLTKLRDAKNCTFAAETETECIIAESVFLQTTTRHVLTLLNNYTTTGPHTVTVSKKSAIGIALVVFVTSEFLIIFCISVIVSVLCYRVYKSNRNAH